MPYNEVIDRRIREAISQWPDTETKKMFGGICHMINGNIACGVYKDFLILRLGEEAAGNALKRTSVRPFDITGRAMRGWVMVSQNGFQQDRELEKWLHQARQFVLSLPSK